VVFVPFEHTCHVTVCLVFLLNLLQHHVLPTLYKTLMLSISDAFVVITASYKPTMLVILGSIPRRGTAENNSLDCISG